MDHSQSNIAHSPNTFNEFLHFIHVALIQWISIRYYRSGTKNDCCLVSLGGKVLLYPHFHSTYIEITLHTLGILVLLEDQFLAHEKEQSL